MNLNEPKTLAYNVNSNFESHMQLIGAQSSPNDRFKIVETLISYL